MTDLDIAGTRNSPAIRTNTTAGTIHLSGDSYPENSFEIFKPLIEWIESFLDTTTHPLSMELELLYMNTSSIRMMMDIFDLLQEAYNGGRPIQVRWVYAPANERIADLASEFKEDCSFPFDIVSRS